MTEDRPEPYMFPPLQHHRGAGRCGHEKLWRHSTTPRPSLPQPRPVPRLAAARGDVLHATADVDDGRLRGIIAGPRAATLGHVHFVACWRLAFAIHARAK